MGMISTTTDIIFDFQVRNCSIYLMGLLCCYVAMGHEQQWIHEIWRVCV